MFRKAASRKAVFGGILHLFPANSALLSVSTLIFDYVKRFSSKKTQPVEPWRCTVKRTNTKASEHTYLFIYLFIYLFTRQQEGNKNFRKGGLIEMGTDCKKGMHQSENKTHIQRGTLIG